MNIEQEQTPLQKKLDSIATGIGKLGVVVAILTLIAIVISELIKTFMDDTKEFDSDFWSKILNGIVTAITVVVVAVPEGLPLAVTIALAYSVGQMFEKKNLVRKLHSSETMGNANEICTDKTGTLTQNKMTVMSCFLEANVTDGETHPAYAGVSSGDDVARSIIFNSTAIIEDIEGKPTCTGNVTEVGLIQYLERSGV